MALMHTNRIWLKPLESVLKFKPPRLPPPAHFRFSSDSSSDGRGDSGQSARHGGMKPRTVGHRPDGLSLDLLGGLGKRTTVRTLPTLPKSVFSAGTAKANRKMWMKEERFLGEPEETPNREETRAAQMQPPDHPLSVAGWRSLSESVGNPPRFAIKMMQAMFAHRTPVSVPKSLLTFVATETGTLSYELLLLYLSMCVRDGHDEEVSDIYDIMRATFPALENGASRLFIKSFSRTAKWREALKILQELKEVFSPVTRNYGDIIAGAMSHACMNTAWALYDEVIEQGLIPDQAMWSALFKGPGQVSEAQPEVMPQSDHQRRLLGILQYLRNNQIYPGRDLADQIKTWFESLPGQKWTGSWTSATLEGQCMCCRSKLESIQLTTAEYQLLKDKVLTDIISGQDIYKKTTPQELESFITFVEKRPPFDVVVDGLNVAKVNANKYKQSATLLAVVSQLRQQGLNVLVLGRKHMLRSSNPGNKNMRLLQQKAHCFFTDNITKDDPFLLYAALHSGNHCQFVSRDLMRDHKASLPDSATRRLFFKWQRGHQLVLVGHIAPSIFQFQTILSYDTILQTTGDSWHIPFDDTEERTSHEVPLQWLCLTRKH